MFSNGHIELTVFTLSSLIFQLLNPVSAPLKQNYYIHTGTNGMNSVQFPFSKFCQTSLVKEVCWWNHMTIISNGFDFLTCDRLKFFIFFFKFEGQFDTDGQGQGHQFSNCSEIC